MHSGKPRLKSLWNALDEAAFGPERILNLREQLPTAAEARQRTDVWLRSRQVIKSQEVLIITGRGNQSVGGVGVVRQEVLAMLPSLRRRGVVESWREHNAGSIVVKLAPINALLHVSKRT
jgi:DNA-nicking Smr family endonuclease